MSTSDSAEAISREPEIIHLPNEPPAFTGSDGAETEVFIQSIRKRAFDQGKQDDNRWIAQYAATCFVKDALRWFEDLDEEVQNDWRLLRKAMLARWPAPGGRKGMPSTVGRHKSPSPCPSPRSSIGGMSANSRGPVLPTPSLIQSALGISSSVAPPNPSPSNTATRTGKVRVVAEEGSPFGSEGEYVSIRLDGRGHFHITRSVENALRVQFTPVGPDAQVLKLLNCSSVHEYLGMQWGGADAVRLLTAPEAHDLSAYLVATSGWNPGSVSTSSPWCKGPAQYKIWNVLLDGTVVPVWKEKKSYALCAAVRTSDKLLAVVSDWDAFSASHGSDWCKARFVFEQE